MRRWNNSARFLTIGVHSATATENDMRNLKSLPKVRRLRLWAYVFDEQERILHVCNREKHRDTKKYFWNNVGAHRTRQRERSQLDTHRVWRKLRALLSLRMEALPALADKSHLSMQSFLAVALFKMRDAIGFHREWSTRQEHGQRWRSDFLRRRLQSAPLPPIPGCHGSCTRMGRRANLP